MRREAGFTLLELIVAFTLVALMAGMVFGALRFALNAYERSQIRIEEEATERVLFDQVKRQIGSLYPVRPAAGFLLTDAPPEAAVPGFQNPLAQLAMSQFPLFFGEPDFVTFVTVAPLILHANPGLTIVRYGLAQDEYGDYYLGAMEDQYTGQESFAQMVDLPTGKPLPLVENVDHLHFEYYGFDTELQTWEWYEAWRGEEMGSVPEAIRIYFNDEYLVVPVNARAFGAAAPTQIQRATGLVGQ